MVNVPKISRSAGNTSAQAPYWTKLPDRKITWVAYLLFFMGGGGCLGFHRFYLGYKKSAKIQLALGVTVLFLPFFIGWNLVFECLYYVAITWYFVDVFLIPKMVREANGTLIVDDR
ncbi:TM2 domain-containing protein [Agrobacterium rosae]|uniref:NINE protein n=1 Tax=Agrobacterium rosae TaxID=1972867 RepID=UPI0019D3BECD|nr:NINE protein [Agrobacterium rosae]MBN7807123.1 TM2 domain-containing protein [Agrobacterium rosae]